MKKSLIALAALATVATAAQAQSSVSIYGIMDAGIARSSGSTAGTETELFSGGLSSSRIGFRGNEDLGGGLSAGFVLESDIAAGTGVAGGTTYTGTTAGASNGTLFSRLSFVNLASKNLGTLTMGRVNRLDYTAAATYDAFGGGNIVGLVRSGYLGNASVYNMTPADRVDARYTNAVQYTSPTYNGLTLSYQRAVGGQAGDSGKQSADGYALNFVSGKLSLAATYQDDKSSTGADTSETTGLFGAYDFGVAKITVANMEKEKASNGLKTKITYIGAIIPVNANINLLATVGKNKNALEVSGAEADVYGLGATYAFSKRTVGYVQHGSVSNNSVSYNYVSSAYTPAAGKDARTTAVGIRHTF
jgi:predicted porin